MNAEAQAKGRRTRAIREINRMVSTHGGLSQAVLVIQQAQRDLDSEITRKLRDVFPEVEHPSYGGSWSCPDSPVNTCVYAAENDPRRDQCIICGDPEERK